jgi:hypothetical protein
MTFAATTRNVAIKVIPSMARRTRRRIIAVAAG